MELGVTPCVIVSGVHDEVFPVAGDNYIADHALIQAFAFGDLSESFKFHVEDGSSENRTCSYKCCLAFTFEKCLFQRWATHTDVK